MLRLGIAVGFVFVLLSSSFRASSQEFLREEVGVIHNVVVTAYTASKKECGNAKGIVAAGIRIRRGMASCDFLPFGTKFMIPGLFGDRIFIVADMFNRRLHGVTKSIRHDIPHKIDIYVKHVRQAKLIGKTSQKVVILSIPGMEEA